MLNVVWLGVDRLEMIAKQIGTNIGARDCSYFHNPHCESMYQLSHLIVEHLVRDLRDWLSPPDPSTNHYIMRDIQYEKTATWVFDEDIFQEWESWGSFL